MDYYRKRKNRKGKEEEERGKSDTGKRERHEIRQKTFGWHIDYISSIRVQWRVTNFKNSSLDRIHDYRQESIIFCCIV